MKQKQSHEIFENEEQITKEQYKIIVKQYPDYHKEYFLTFTKKEANEWINAEKELERKRELKNNYNKK